LQEIDTVGGVAKHEDPLATPAFSCSHHPIELMCSLLTHYAKQIDSACWLKLGKNMSSFCGLGHVGSLKIWIQSSSNNTLRF